MAEWFEHWFDDDYALLYAHRDEAEARVAVATALREAPELGSGPVLDLACGTGRHLAVLRETNPAAVGLDLSEALLGQAPAGLTGRLVRGDMRALPIRPASLSGICMWFTPFGYFDDAQNHALLAGLREALRPGGVLVLDYLNADLLRASLVPEDVAERSGIRIHSRRRIVGDRVEKEMTLTRLGTGEVRTALESVRIYDPPALTALASEEGLRLRRAWGAYAGEAFGPASPRWIALFERPH